MFRFVPLDSYITPKVEGGTQFLVMCALYEKSSEACVVLFGFRACPLPEKGLAGPNVPLKEQHAAHGNVLFEVFRCSSGRFCLSPSLHGRLVRCPTVEARTGWTPSPHPPLTSVQQRLRENASLTMLRYWPALERREVRQGHSID